MANDAFSGTYTTHCLTTGERLTLPHGPKLADHQAGSWSYHCPLCGIGHRTVYGPEDVSEMAGRFVKIDIPVETDLGELIPGQHIVLEGITLRTPWGSALRSTFVPGFPKSNRRLNTSWGLGDVADDLGTAYDHGGEGGWGPDADGIVRRGDEHLGNGIPSAASWLTIAFIPAHGWDVPGRWITKIMVDLTLNKIVGVCDWAGR